jgi:aspartyl-tRNA(Asn)/glutamyl-tRNA(Gln) amidotransferase subunit B
VALGAPAKEVANWIMGQIMRQLSAQGMEAKDMTFTPKTMARLIALVSGGTLNRNTAVKVFDAVFMDDGDVDAYVKEHGLEQVSDAGLVNTAVEEVFAANPKSIEDFKSGKEKAFGFLMGQTMQKLKGKADPKVVNAAIRSKLGQM